MHSPFFQRVQPENIQDFIYRLSNVIQKLDAFINLNVIASQLIFKRVNLGLNNLVKFVADSDVNFMRQILNGYQIGYIQSYGNLVDRITVLVDDLCLNLPIYISGSITNDSNPSVTVSIKLLAASLNSLLVSFNGGNSLKNAPNRLVSEDRHWTRCQNLLGEIQASLNEMRFKQSSAWQNETILLKCSGLEDLNDLYTRRTSYKCAGGFVKDLNALVHSFSELKLEMARFNGTVSFYNSGYLNASKIDLEHIQITKTKLSDQLSSYSENRTTQIKL